MFTRIFIYRAKQTRWSRGGCWLYCFYCSRKAFFEIKWAFFFYVSLFVFYILSWTIKAIKLAFLGFFQALNIPSKQIWSAFQPIWRPKISQISWPVGPNRGGSPPHHFKNCSASPAKLTDFLKLYNQWDLRNENW